jgi:NCAIR mutase (PurE)-related protein
MTRDRLRALLERFQNGTIDLEAVVDELAMLPFRETLDARVDTHRALRQGIPEVVLGQGKSPSQIVRIVRTLRDSGTNVLVTRVNEEAAQAVRGEFPEVVHHADARLLVLRSFPVGEQGRGTIAVISAGTSDHSVAEEAALTAEILGHKVERLADVGVAGLHRLLASIDVIRSAEVVIVVAGMEGALPSVVGGLVDRPVIAVPTSVGYGASFGGVAALLGMLNSCASNVSVVNIDNGFGAAVVASLINRVAVVASLINRV